MRGFFNIRATETKEKRKLTAPSTNTRKSNKVYDCETCGLYEKCQSPKMEYSGEGKRGVLIIAEAPGKSEDEQGIQLVGQAGSYFRDVLDAGNFDLDRDAFKTNCLACRPPDNRKPTDMELKCCRPRWEKVIEETKPKFIWLLGGTALDAFYAQRLGKDAISITSWRRHCIPDRQYGCWVLPMYHPSFVKRTGDKLKILDTVFKKDILWAISNLKRTSPQFKEYTNREELLEYDAVIRVLQLIDDDTMIFDYETNNLKPHRDEAKILTLAFKLKKQKKSYAFPFQWPGFWSEDQFNSIKRYWLKALTNPTVKKVAHNVKFEHNWSVLKVGEPVGWHFDTMLAQHMMDTRPGMSNLKTQAFIRWGIENYDEGVKKFITDTDEYGFNKLAECDLQTVLIYNNIDALLEEELYGEQTKAASRDTELQRITNLYFEGALSFADTEQEGIAVDEEYYSEETKRIERKMLSITKWLLRSDEAVKFEKYYGRELSLTSTKDLSNLFYEVLKEEVVKRTEKGGVPSMDEDALANFKSEFARRLLKLKKLLKLKNTYIKNFVVESVNGRMYPSFNLNLAESGRSSADRPNFQNIPKRDEEAMKIVRGGLIPSTGNELGSADYKQIEVCLQAVLSNDQEMIRYVTDPKSDMHRDQAMEIFMLPASEISKPLRHLGKNGFVFPEIYGDWYESIAKAMWKELDGHSTVSGIEVISHLRGEGIKRYDDFEDHMKYVERKFWDKFHATRDWRDEIVEEYKKKLYIGNLFGFKRNGYLKRNQICNTPVQSAAFQCLLWSFVEINKIRKREHWLTKIIGQIHDQIVFDMVPSEKKHVIKVVTDIMCNKLRESYPWISVPLRVDFDFSGINQPWSMKGDE
jgi:uracil-DNA glycosylase family 4